MTAATVLAAVSCLIWAGMVLAISFLEAPLKFRAPGVTIPLGLGIGRLVFRALNTVEGVLALLLVVAAVIGATGSGLPVLVLVAGAIAVVMLLAQVIGVRPGLNRRSEAVLAGHEGPRSQLHLVYVALELIKLPALLVAGIGALVLG